jgi:GntR family transcriptional regulator, transcriptional repressor for pyruvate dehydrogenase complex
MQTGTIPDTVAKRLQADILAGRFSAGSALPPQRELAREMGVSRASLREAVTILETLGFVVTLPGKGVFVSEPGAGLSPALSSDDIARTYQLRFALEPFVASLVAMTARDELVGALRATHERMRAAMAAMDLVQAAQLDFEFHRLILVAAGNPMFIAALQPVMTPFRESQRLPFANREVVWAPVEEHERILREIERRSPSAAAEAMRRHILGAAHRTGNLFLRP